MGKNGNRDRLYFLGLQNHCGLWLQPWNQNMLVHWKESYDKPRRHIKNQRYYFINKGPSSQSYGFSSRHVWMWELDYKEGWAPKNWCFWTVVLEKTLESPLDSKDIKPANPKGDQSWIFTGRTDAEAEAPIIWPPEAKSWLIGKDPDAGKDWRQEKGMTEVGMVGWHCRIQRTWVWANCGRWWKTEKPGLLQSMGSQRVGHDWVPEQNPLCISHAVFSIWTTSRF